MREDVATCTSSSHTYTLSCISYPAAVDFRFLYAFVPNLCLQLGASKHTQPKRSQQQGGLLSAHLSMCYRISRAVTSSQMTAVAQGMQQGLFPA